MRWALKSPPFGTKQHHCLNPGDRESLLKVPGLCERLGFKMKMRLPPVLSLWEAFFLCLCKAFHDGKRACDWDFYMAV